MFTSEIVGPHDATIRGTGKLNMVSAPALREAVLALINDERHNVVVDLSGVDFVDSSGLGALVACLKSTRQAGCDLRIAAPGKQVLMVLKLSNLDRVFPIFTSAEEAINA
ncbi:MAG: STAS domain-containing protein [Glaciihabitans sp.]